MPSTKPQSNFRLPLDQLDALRAIKERDGIPISEQVRRGIDLWLATKQAPKAETARKRVAPRQRA